MIAAGFETSANALAFAVYCISRNPRVEAALLAEIDAAGRDKVRWQACAWHCRLVGAGRVRMASQPWLCHK
jgi:cytochrome P450